MDIALILSKIRPGANWSMNNDEFENLEWKDKSEKPTYQEVVDSWAEVELESSNLKVENMRRQAYQKESDPLFFEYQRELIEKSVWLDKVQEIKDRYPYTAFSQT